MKRLIINKYNIFIEKFRDLGNIINSVWKSGINVIWKSSGSKYTFFVRGRINGSPKSKTKIKLKLFF